MLAPAVNQESSQFVRLGSRVKGEESKSFFGLDAAALSAVMAGMGEPVYRSRQLAEAIYRQRLSDINSISTLPVSLRERLEAARWRVGRPRIAQVFKSIDGTERYLIDCDGESSQTVETVWMPEGDGGESGEEIEADSTSQPVREDRAWSRATISLETSVMVFPSATVVVRVIRKWAI